MDVLPQDDALSSLARSHRISFGVMLTIILQTIALVGWLVQLRTEVTQLRGEVTTMLQREERIDREGTRALSIVQQRLNDSIASNTAQDIRLRELENRLGEMQQKTSENRFWLDQVMQQLRNCAPRLPIPPPP